jgi:hypothetical protein
MMKENSYNYGRDKKTQDCLQIHMWVGWWSRRRLFGGGP